MIGLIASAARKVCGECFALTVIDRDKLGEAARQHQYAVIFITLVALECLERELAYRTRFHGSADDRRVRVSGLRIGVTVDQAAVQATVQASAKVLP